ncbi:MAG TPA: hypothetical protein VMB50_01775 [Myxococcales bacterium]|nr:hypothetical protein [Myxococcales bacterium]
MKVQMLAAALLCLSACPDHGAAAPAPTQMVRPAMPLQLRRPDLTRRLAAFRPLQPRAPVAAVPDAGAPVPSRTR